MKTATPKPGSYAEDLRAFLNKNEKRMELCAILQYLLVEAIQDTKA
jgi:hypothetical protein